MEPSPPSKTPRRWLRFRLRTLLVLVALVGIFLGLFLAPMRRERKAAALVKADAYSVSFEDPQWLFDYPRLQEFLNSHEINPWRHVVTVRLNNPTDVQLAALESLPYLRYVEAHDLSDRQIEPISKLKRLQWLNLSESGLTDLGVAQFMNLRSLDTLHLEQAHISGECFKRPSEWNSLNSFRLVDCKSLTDNGIENIGKLPVLSELTFEGCDLDDYQISLLANLSRLTSLKLVGERNAQGTGLHAFKGHLNLQTISFTNGGLNDAGLEAVAGLPQVTKLVADDSSSITAYSIRQLGGMKSLEYLSLRGCAQLGDEVTHSVVVIPQLKRLSLRDCGLSNESLVQLAKLPALERLDISGNSHIDQRSLEPLAALKSLKELWLGETNIPNETMVELEKSLPNCKLHEWSFMDGPVGQVGG